MDHLPPHVIDTIVSYTIGQDKSKTELRTDDKPVTVPYTLYPLMGICREWRRVASSFIGESAIISINSQDTDSHNGPKHTQSLGRIIAAGLEHHVRHLQLYCTPEDVANGTVHSVVGTLFTQCEGRLTKVYTVTACVSVLNSYEQYHRHMRGQPAIDPQELARIEKGFNLNIGRIGELLREAMPNIVSVVYSGDHYSMLDTKRINTTALSAFLGVAPSIQCLSVLGNQTLYANLDSKLAPRLKHMHVDLSDGSGNGLIELVVRNADCLEMLSVEFQSSEPLNKLFHNPADKSPVVYSRLHTFTAPFKNGWRVQDDGCAPTANPFPVLRKFVWKRMCQFRTSSVFRWIQPTVEVMEVHISYQNYEMFVKDGVFDAGSFPNLRRVDLSWYTGPDGISIVDPAGLLPRVLSLSPVLEEVAFDKRVSYACRIVAPLYRCRDLKKLTIAGIQFTIADAIGLINTFPNLRSVVLSLKTSHDVNERGDVSDAEIKEFLGKHNHVVNSQLRTLEISTFVFTTRPRAAQHILLLASIFKSIQGIKIRSLNEKRDAAILGALDEAKQRKCFDNDGEGRLQCIEFSLVKK